MLGAFVGLSSAASPSGHGHSAASHADNGGGHGNSGHGNAAGTNVATGDTRPGWGCGDLNHVHTGPPGGGDGFDPCTFHVRTVTSTIVSGTETVTTTETVTGTETATATVTETATTTATT